MNSMLENMDTPTPPRRKASTMPYIMPDGRPLSAFLADNNLIKPAMRRHSHRRNRAKDKTPGWSSNTQMNAASQSTYSQKPATEVTEAESAELLALSRVGQRRQRRWLNDRLLRDMAPTLTAKDMESLFKPAPFGDTGHISAFTLAAAPEHAQLWELFRSVDADKQGRVLKKWEEHVEELRQEGEERTTITPAMQAAATAMHGWASVGPRGRKALRRAPFGCVEELENQILEFIEQPPSDDQTKELVMILEDSFQRLLAHSISEFHSLQSFGRNSAGGVREVVIRSGGVSLKSGSDSSPVPLSPPSPEVPLISCVDVLWLLEEGDAVNVSLQTLQDRLLRPSGGLGSPRGGVPVPAVVSVACAT